MTTPRRIILASSLLATTIMIMPAHAQVAVPGVGTNYETRLSALEEQMRALNGNIEQLTFGIRRLDQAMQRLQNDTDARVSRIESAMAAAQAAPPPTTIPSAVPPPASTPAPTAVAPPTPTTTIIENTTAPDTQTQTSQEPPPPTAPVKGTLGAIKMQDGKITGAINNPQAPALPDTPPDYGLTPQEQYDRAFDLLRETDYEAASDAFKSFIDKNPHDKLVDEAKYWYGETLYVRDKFDSAAVAFADAWEQNPNGPKAPESLLKLALSLEKIGKTADACTTLDSLKSKYPKAPVKIRQTTDQERASLKCSALQQAAPASTTTKKKQ